MEYVVVDDVIKMSNDNIVKLQYNENIYISLSFLANTKKLSKAKQKKLRRHICSKFTHGVDYCKVNVRSKLLYLAPNTKQGRFIQIFINQNKLKNLKNLFTVSTQQSPLTKVLKLLPKLNNREEITVLEQLKPRKKNKKLNQVTLNQYLTILRVQLMKSGKLKQ